MKPERFTRNIRKKQDYCEFELKDCPYKDIYGFEKYSELEENVDCDLSLAIDKLGKLEDIEQYYGIDLVTLVKVLKIVAEKEVDIGYLKRHSPTLEAYNKAWCLGAKDLTKEEFELAKRVAVILAKKELQK